MNSMHEDNVSRMSDTALGCHADDPAQQSETFPGRSQGLTAPNAEASHADVVKRCADLMQDAQGDAAKIADARREQAVHLTNEISNFIDAVVPAKEITGSKPAMAELPCGYPAKLFPVGESQGVPPVDRSHSKSDGKRRLEGRPLPTTLSIKLTSDLRQRIAAAARVDGRSDSAWLRHVALTELGLKSPFDAASGQRPRIPPDSLVGLATAVRALGEAYSPLSTTPVDIAGVKDALERAREVLIPIVMTMARAPKC